MEQRGTSCLALFPDGSASGAFKFYSLKTGKIITADKWKSLPYPPEIVDFMNSWASNGKKITSRDPIFALRDRSTIINDEAPGDFFLEVGRGYLPKNKPAILHPPLPDPSLDISEANPNDPLEQSQPIQQHAPSSSLSNSLSPSENILPPVLSPPPLPPPPEPSFESVTSISPSNVIPTVPSPSQVQPSVDISSPLTESDPISAPIPNARPATPPVMEPPIVPPAVRKPKSTVPPLTMNLRSKGNVTVSHMTVKQAINSFGDEAEKAINAELLQMIEKRVWTPVDSKGTKRTIPSSIFLTEKKDA